MSRVPARAGLAVLLVLAAGCQSQVIGSGAYAGSGPAGVPSGSAAPGGSSAPGGPGGSGTPSGTAAPGTGVPATGFQAPFAGAWSGQMSQPNSKLPTWTAQLTMPAGAGSGRLVIAGYCTGILTLLTATTTLLIGVERVTSDPKNVCADSGAVTLAVSGDRLLMRWVDSADEANIATGVLSRH